MCDHFSIDCFCENEYIVLKGEPKKPKAAKRVIDPIVHHATTMNRIEELELVQVVHSDGTSFKLPEYAVRAEVLHEIGEGTKSQVVQITDKSEHDDPTVESIQGDPSDTRQLKNSFMLEMNDAIAVVPADDSQSSFLDETKMIVDGILIENLNEKVAGEKDQKTKTIMECNKSFDEAKTKLIDEKMMQVIREVVVEEMQSVAPKMKKIVVKEVADDEPHKEMAAEIDEHKEKISPKSYNEVNLFREMMTNDVQLSETSKEIILSPIVNDGLSHDLCTECSQRASQKLKYSMSQDPTISLEGTKQLFENYNEAQIDPNLTETVQMVQNELQFIATELDQELDKVLEPLVQPTNKVVDIIIKGFIEDSSKFSNVLNEAMENVINTTVVRVVDVADFVVTGTAKVADILVNTVDAFIRAKDTMATEGKNIASDLFSGGNSNFSFSAEESFLSPNGTNKEENDANVKSCIDSLSSGPQKKTPLRWLAWGLRKMLAPTKQSANICLTQWPACSGLSEWPVTGQPGN